MYDMPIDPITGLILVPLMLIGFAVQVVLSPFQWLANVIRKEKPVQTEMIDSNASQIIELNETKCFEN